MSTFLLSPTPPAEPAERACACFARVREPAEPFCLFHRRHKEFILSRAHPYTNLFGAVLRTKCYAQQRTTMKPNASPVAAAFLALSSASCAVGVAAEEPSGDGAGAVSSSESTVPSGERRLLKRDELPERRGSAQLRGEGEQQGGEESRALNHVIMAMYDSHRKPTGSTLFQQSRGKTQPSQQVSPPMQVEPAARTANAPGCGGAGTYHSPYLGCWDDKVNDRAFPFELYEGHSSDKRFGHGALDCERECSQRGYRYFGRQFKGQCFCGADLSQITRHGSETGCDCCGANVGSSRFCLWENSKNQNSSAQAPYIEPVLPQRPQQTTSTENNHHLVADGGSDSKGTVSTNQQISSGSSPKPTGGFRLRMHWERGYRWQGDPREKWWCMECRGDCRRDSSVMINQCDKSTRQRWLAVGNTVRPASNPSLCLTVRGFSGKKDPVRLRNCSHGGDQRFNELKSSGKFELHPETRKSHCLSQHHQ